MPRFQNIQQDLVIDVRSRLEFFLGHLDGAVNIPVDELPQGLTGRAGVGLDSRILVYCASGGRSAAASSALRAAGYRRVTDAGGMAAARAEYAAA
jgi:phage shock protein E